MSEAVHETTEGRHFPDFIQAFISYTRKLNYPPAYSKWAAISILAGAVDRRIWASNGFWTTYPNLYVMLVGDRGIGKSTITNVAIEMLECLDHVTMAPNKINEASLIAKLIKTGGTNYFDLFGKRYKNSSVFIYASEATNTFKEMHQGGSIIPLLTDLYNCSDKPWSETRGWGKETRSHGEELIYNPCINLLACTTPDWLATKVMSKSDIEGGFGSRVNIVVHEGSWDFEEGMLDGDSKDAKIRNMLIHDLKHISQLSGVFTVKPSWISIHNEYSKQHSAFMKMLKHKDAVLASCLARKTSTAMMKLGMILAVSKGDELVLDDKLAHMAFKILTDLEKTMPYAFTAYNESREVQHVLDVWRFIKETNADQIHFTELCIIFANRYTTKRVKEAIGELCVQGKLKINKEKSKGFDVIILDVIKEGKPINGRPENQLLV